MNTFQLIIGAITVLALVGLAAVARELLDRWRTRRLLRGRGLIS